MSIANNTENNILALIFNATTWANVAVNATSSPITALGCSLQTADPTDAGTMSSSETSYGSYARVNTISRTTGGFSTPSGGSTVFAANVDFPSCTSSTATITHASVGMPSGGAVDIFFSGTVSPNISVSSGVIPRLTTASSFTID